jgi:WD40 repeat protein
MATAWRVFHVESGQERARFGLDRASTSLVFVDDDTLLAFTPVAVQRLRIGARAEPLGPLAAGRELVVTSIGDGGKVVAGRTETSLVVVRPGADAPLVERPRAFVAALSFDGSLFAYAEGLAARLLHTATGEDAVATSGHSGHVMGMRFDDDAVTTWSVREAIVWDPATGRERADARPVLTPAPLALEAQLRHEGRIPRDTLENRSEVLLGRGPLVLLRATDSARGAELWNAATAERLVTYEPGAFAYHAVLSPSGDRLAMSFFRQGLVQLFELGSSTPITSWTLSSRGGAPRLAWAPDGAYLAAAPESAGVSVLEARKAGREVEHGDRGCAKSGLAWSPDGTLIAGTSGKRLTLWDRNGAVLAVVPMRWRALAFSPDGKRLGVADEARPRMLEVAELLGVGGAAQAKRKRS